MKAIPALGLGQIELIQQYLTALAPPAVADSQTNGTYLFARYCARCHGDSAGGGSGPNIQGAMNLVPVLSRGFGRRMPAFAWFSASQIEALTAFLARVSGGGGTELPAPGTVNPQWIRFQPPWQQQFDDHRAR